MPGDVISYGYLWSHESEAGREGSAKERPCVVVIAVGDGEHPTMIVLPVTSRDPGRPEAIPLGAGALGLGRPSWIVPWEVNVFRWMGPDVGRAPKPAGAWWRMGRLPPDLRTLLADRVEAALKKREGRITRRID